MRQNAFLPAFVIAAILLIIVIFNSFVIVPAGHRGIVLQLGAVKGSVDEGANFIIPFIQKIVKMDIRIQKLQTPASAASKDLQTVDSLMAINYHITPDVASKLYQSVGLGYSETIISPAVQESVKSVTARYTAEELITKRRQVSEEISDLLKERLSIHGIIVNAFSVLNFDFSKRFNEAVEEKLAAEQSALKANRDLDRIKIEAEQKIAQAQAEAESLKIQRMQITPDLLKLREIEVQQRAVEKWDGKLPTVTGGAMPFIQLPQR